MERWHTTICTKEASAFYTLGTTIKIQSSIDERTSSRTVRFLISPTTEDKQWSTGKIRHAFKTGSLQRQHSGHPYLTIRRAFHNREALLEIQKSGRRFRLALASPEASTYQLVPSDTGLPGTTGQLAVLKTRDIKLAATLLTVGFPLLRITGVDRAHEYTLSALPAPRAAAGIDAALLCATWRTDPAAMSFQLPFTQAMQGLSNREKIKAEVLLAIDTILLHKPRTTSHAAIRADAAPAAWDAAKAFFTKRP